MASTGRMVFGLLLLTLLSSPLPAQTAAISETYFILTNITSVMVLNMQGKMLHELSNTFSNQVGFDPITERIFWPDFSNRTFNRALLNGNQRTVLQLPSGSDPRGVAVDHILQLVFYCNMYDNLIRVMDTDGGSDRLVRDQGLSRPQILAVDVIHELLYYSEDGTPGNIGRMHYNGSSHEILLNSGRYYPRGLALDVRGGRMYWSFSGGTIESARLDGTDRTLVLQDLEGQHGLGFLDGVLYFTVDGQTSIFSVTVHGTDRQELKTNVTATFLNMEIYSKSRAITLGEKLAAFGLTETPSTTPRSKEFSLTPSVFLILAGSFVNLLC